MYIIRGHGVTLLMSLSYTGSDFLCQNWGSYSGVDEDSSLVRSYDLSTAKWLIDVPKRGSDFQSKVLFDSEGCHTTLRQNFSNYSPFDTAYLTRRLESSKLSVRNTGCTVL